MPYYNRDPKRDHNFDNHPYKVLQVDEGMDNKIETTVDGLG